MEPKTPVQSLETLASDQKAWSATSRRLAASIRLYSRLTLGLLIAGAVLEALAAQLYTTLRTLSEVAGYLGAVFLAMGAVARSQWLGRNRQQAWILARAAAESFKREMFLYRTSSGPYRHTNNNPDLTLFERRDEILRKLVPVQKYVIPPAPERSVSLEVLTPADYISQRVQDQVDWYRRRAGQHASAYAAWNVFQYLLGIAGALLGVTLTYTHNQAYAAWVSVITTISGAVAAHVLTERYEQLTISYRTTADRLTGILGRWNSNRAPLSDLVEQIEDALLQENQAWVAAADEQLKSSAASGSSSHPPA